MPAESGASSDGSADPAAAQPPAQKRALASICRPNANRNPAAAFNREAAASTIQRAYRAYAERRRASNRVEAQTQFGTAVKGTLATRERACGGPATEQQARQRLHRRRSTQWRFGRRVAVRRTALAAHGDRQACPLISEVYHMHLTS